MQSTHPGLYQPPAVHGLLFYPFYILPLFQTQHFFKMSFFFLFIYSTVFLSCPSCPYNRLKETWTMATQQTQYIAKFLSHCTGEAVFPMNMHSSLGKWQQILQAFCHCPLTDHRSSLVLMMCLYIAYSEGMAALLSPTAGFHSVCSCLWDHHGSIVFVLCRLCVSFPGYCRGQRHAWTDSMIVRDSHLWRNMLNKNL